MTVIGSQHPLSSIHLSDGFAPTQNRPIELANGELVMLRDIAGSFGSRFGRGRPIHAHEMLPPRFGQGGLTLDDRAGSFLFRFLGRRFQRPHTGSVRIDGRDIPVNTIRTSWDRIMPVMAHDPETFLDKLIDVSARVERRASDGHTPKVHRYYAKALNRIHAIRNVPISALMDPDRPNLVNPRLRAALKELALRVRALPEDQRAELIKNYASDGKLDSLGELWAARAALRGMSAEESMQQRVGILPDGYASLPMDVITDPAKITKLHPEFRDALSELWQSALALPPEERAAVLEGLGKDKLETLGDLWSLRSKLGEVSAIDRLRKRVGLPPTPDTGFQASADGIFAFNTARA